MTSQGAGLAGHGHGHTLSGHTEQAKEFKEDSSLKGKSIVLVQNTDKVN